ncbi:hypothetical protein [Flagellimonas sp.]|uniref:hypothetical protein n=1 Tax=Flagellimonas sp. TaxID=2058762 RepID=UPI003AB89187
MKTLKTLIILFALSMGATSCSDDTEGPMPVTENPLEAYHLTNSFEGNGHMLELYSEKERLTTGYNELYVQIKDLSTGTYIPNASITWNPMMHMIGMSHSCPKSDITVTEKETVYKGYLVFQMASNADEYWELNLEYSFGGATYTTSKRIEVKAPTDGNKTVNVFTGTDDKRYVLAMLPFAPKVAINDFSAVLFEMESMMSFPVVEDYTITIDPRMPGMGNHSSPNNENLTYDPDSGSYSGKLSLTMTGYWKINLQLLNASEDVLKGEMVTEGNESSSLYFEIEF